MKKIITITAEELSTVQAKLRNINMVLYDLMKDESLPEVTQSDICDINSYINDIGEVFREE